MQSSVTNPACSSDGSGSPGGVMWYEASRLPGAELVDSRGEAFLLFVATGHRTVNVGLEQFWRVVPLLTETGTWAIQSGSEVRHQGSCDAITWSYR